MPGFRIFAHTYPNCTLTPEFQTGFRDLPLASQWKTRTVSGSSPTIPFASNGWIRIVNGKSARPVTLVAKPMSPRVPLGSGFWALSVLRSFVGSKPAVAGSVNACGCLRTVAMRRLLRSFAIYFVSRFESANGDTVRLLYAVFL